MMTTSIVVLCLNRLYMINLPSLLVLLHPGSAEARVVPGRPPQSLRGRGLCQTSSAGRAGGAEAGAAAAG